MDSERMLRTIVDNITDGVIIVDDHGIINLFSSTAERMFGYPENEVLEKEIVRLIPQLRSDTEAGLNGPMIPDTREVEGIRKDGTAFQVDLTVHEVQNQGRRTFVAIVRDITERKQAEQQLIHLAHYDALTGLPTRTLFQDRAKHALARADRDEKLAAVMYMDLDHFKQVNDGLSHEAGDQLLKATAKRITSCLREVDTVSRLGGDEFAVILESIPHIDSATIAAQKILDVMQDPFHLDGHEVHMTVSIGITLYPMDDKDFNSLLKDADMAMYRVKQAGRNGYQLFGADMAENTAVVQLMEKEIAHALDRGELLLYYQPRVDLLNGRISGVEALLRWQHPERGLLCAQDFMPVLEKTKHIFAVDEWVLHTACAQSRRWQQTGLLPVRMTVNISPYRFRRRGLKELVGIVLKETGLLADFLELDVPGEDMVGVSKNHYSATLQGLRALGVHIALADCSAGNPFIEALQRYPLDVIKIDRSFVRDAVVDRDHAAVVQAIIALARALKLKVVAAGVETKEQLALLRDYGCDAIQGFLFSKPVSVDKLTELLKEGKRLI